MSYTLPKIPKATADIIKSIIASYSAKADAAVDAGANKVKSESIFGFLTVGEIAGGLIDQATAAVKAEVAKLDAEAYAAIDAQTIPGS